MVNCEKTGGHPTENGQSTCGKIKAFWRSPVGMGMGVALFIAIICGVIIPVVVNSVNSVKSKENEDAGNGTLTGD